MVIASDGDGSFGFRGLRLRTNYTPDARPFDTFYVPALTQAMSYDRAVGYWSAAELRLAAQGVAHFLANGGRMRLVVGAQLREGDVDAVLAGEPLADVLVRKLIADPGVSGAIIVRDELLGVLAWMVKAGRLEIRVGVPTAADGRPLTQAEQGGYFHTKLGVLTDAFGDRIAFVGSGNSSVAAWQKNHETFNAFYSWKPEIWNDYGQPQVDSFEQLWNGRPDDGWVVVDLPTAVRDQLIRYAPQEPPSPTANTAAPPDAASDIDSETASPVVDQSDLPTEDDSPIDQQVTGRANGIDKGTVLTDIEPATVPATLSEAEIRVAWDELVALGRAPLAGDWTVVGTAAVVPLPHQARLIERVVRTYPRGYLLADEVGLGKTIEAGLVIRELMLSGKATSALLLVPASVMVQWQEELHEKMSLDVLRYDKGVFLDRHGKAIASPPEANPWSAFPIVLASSHLARRRSRRRELLDAGPWDIVLVDEAHHARRQGSKSNGTPNSLLAMLLEMREAKMWKTLYLATATPMQMNPHEAWDLISVLGLNGAWAASAAEFLRYFEALRTEVPDSQRDWRFLSQMLRDYYADPAADTDQELRVQVEDALGWVDSANVTAMDVQPPSPALISTMPNATSTWANRWLRRHNPMRDRVYRNSRSTLRAYQAAGIIPASVVIPVRDIHDEFIPLAPREQKLYDRIETYIRRHYNSYLAGSSSQALGFIMTVYRRRLTSSFAAITKSLQRRLEALENNETVESLLTDDDRADVENALFDPEVLDVSADLLAGEIDELRDFVHDLSQISAEDTKATKLIDDLHAATKGGHSSTVVFTQYTDTMDYVRERLLAAHITKIGCYSGRGGEVWDAETRHWTAVTKGEIKTLFRDGALDVLIGTDAMSEGLNLQTTGRLINYDMPWNLMRVEQRIGRVDRIGASHETIEISNYFYKNTVEQRVYQGIKDDFGDFTNIVGEAAPVLANVEQAIEQLALSGASATGVANAVITLRAEADELANRAVQTADIGATDTGATPPPDLTGAIGLADIKQVLLSNSLTAPHFNETADPQVLKLRLPTQNFGFSLNAVAGTAAPSDYGRFIEPGIEVTFDRAAADRADSDVVLLTFGSPELSALLPTSGGATYGRRC